MSAVSPCHALAPVVVVEHVVHVEHVEQGHSVSRIGSRGWRRTTPPIAAAAAHRHAARPSGHRQGRTRRHPDRHRLRRRGRRVQRRRRRSACSTPRAATAPRRRRCSSPASRRSTRSPRSVPDEVRALVAEFWPGGLTVILRARTYARLGSGRDPRHRRAAHARRHDRPRTARRDRTARRLERQRDRRARGADRRGRRGRCWGMPWPSTSRRAPARRASGPRRSSTPPRSSSPEGKLRIVRSGVISDAEIVAHRGGRPMRNSLLPPRRRRRRRSSPSGSRYLIYKLSHRYRLYPKIRERDVHTRPTPRLGGVAMFLGIVAAFAIGSFLPPLGLIYADPRQDPRRSSARALLIVLIGVADDIWDLDWLTKLAGQIIAAGLLAWQGVQIGSIPIPAADRHRLAVDVADPHRVHRRAGDERHQLHRRARRARRRGRDHRQQRVLHLRVPDLVRHQRADRLLQPRRSSSPRC